jgi:hypothetical protein
MSNFMKIRPVVAELFHADRGMSGQTDRTKLTVTFLQFCERAKKVAATIELAAF